MSSPDLDREVECCFVAAFGRPPGSEEQIQLRRVLDDFGSSALGIQKAARAGAAGAIRAQLDRILGSNLFLAKRGPRVVQASGKPITGLGKILSFIVEAVLDGRNVTQYDLASELYQSQDERSLQKTRMRVGRVREKLAAFYEEGLGRADPITITLDTGGYVPAFKCRAHSTGEEDPARLDMFTLTGNIGTEVFAALSPDGTTVAFSWNGEDERHYNIYVKNIAANGLRRLTTSDSDDLSPTWSPDGKMVAFLRVRPKGAQILAVPARGGDESHVTDVFPIRWEVLGRQLAWHPRERALALVDKSSPQRPFQIVLHTLVNGARTQLTDPPSEIVGDSDPAFSPNGAAQLAFIRTTQVGMKDVYVRTSPSEPPRRVTADAAYVSGVTWSADAEQLIFSSARVGFSCLWRTHVYGRPQPTLISGLPGDAVYPFVRGRRLAYTKLLMNTDVYRLAIRQSEGAHPLIRSTRHDVSPQVSPDGKSIAFASDRDGGFEIWVCCSDGSSPRRLTRFRSPLGAGSPRWSPDGSRVIFDCRAGGKADVYVVPVVGGACEQVTFGPGENVVPSWSKTGWIYFSSNRTGEWQIWRMRPGDPEARPITRRGGFAPFEAPGGESVYYAKGRSQAGLCRVHLPGGDEECVTAAPPRGLWGYWAVAESGLYFLDFERENVSLLNVAGVTLSRFDWVSNNVSVVRHIEGVRTTPYAGIAVSPDESWLVFTQLEHSSGNIILKEHFD